MLIVQADEANGMSLVEIRDNLLSMGFDNALASDGSSSATLVKDHTIYADPAFYEDRSIPSGITFTSPYRK